MPNLFPIDGLSPLHDSVSSNLIDARFDHKGSGRHVGVKPFGGEAGHDGHGTGSEPVRRELQFESTLAFAVAFLQHELAFLRPGNEPPARGSVAVARLGRVVESQRVLAGLLSAALETLLPAAAVAVVEEVGVVALVRVVVLKAELT